MMFLNPIKIGWVLLLMGSHFFAWHLGKEFTQAAWNKQLIEQSEISRNREKLLTIENQKVAHEHQKDKNRRDDIQRATVASMREFQTIIAKRDNTETTSGTDDPYRAIASECAAAVTALDAYAQGLASKATSLQSFASQVCVSQ